MGNWIVGLLLSAAVIAIGAFFSAAGGALVSARRSALRELAEKGNRSAALALRLLESPERFYTVNWLIQSLAWIAAACVGSLTVGLKVSDALHNSGVPLLQEHSLVIGVGLVGGVIWLLVTLVGDIFPVSLSTRYGERMALAAAKPLAVVTWFFGPLGAGLMAVANTLLRPFGVKARSTTSIITEEELRILVEAGEEGGVIEEDEREMIDSILEFTDTVVRQVMVPRIDMHVIANSATVAESVDEIIECGHSRMPVYQDSVDTVVGVVHAKDLLKLMGSPEGRSTLVAQIMRPAYFVPENKRVSDLLTELRTNKVQLAIVRDEYGGTAGLVTLEDLIEEIVGEIVDEYDQEEPLVIIEDENSLLVDARANIGDLNEDMGLGMPEGEFETVGGFVFGLLGREPEVGDEVRYNGWLFTVEAKEDRRLRKIRIDHVSAEAEGEAED